ncbi:ABC transporter ATP-binding protein [Dactylosporangium sp. CA-092794]|uniref:ABC transporter ATP-binding protein n=1 Tax=Dactylosporangium sp. CA-092794 TaxID=3239929 RepID=UPI003D931D29
MAEVKLEDVSKVFAGETVAVDHVSLAVADGEFLVLVGPSGCGKSTVLRIVAGLEDATEGVVSIDGKVVNDLAPKDRDIAMVFQNYALYPHMTVDDNLSFALRLRHVPRAAAQRRVLETAQVLGLEEYLSRKPKALSGGQRQRVAMGRAIVREPRVFLMDEPLSNLDAKLRVSMRAELTRLHQRYRTTTIYVTHDQVEAMTLGDRIAVLDHGRLQQVGTPDELYFRPANVFVAGFMGSPSMNLITAEASGGDRLVLAVGGNRWPVPAEGLAQVPALAGYAGQSIVVGLRPDAFAWPPTDDGPAITVTALAVESLGNEKHIVFEAPGAASGPAAGRALGVEGDERLWTAKVNPRCPATIGDRLTLGVDMAAAYYFDPGTGLALATDRGPAAPRGAGERAAATAHD